MAEEMITEEDRKFAESLPLNPQVQRKSNRFWATVYGGAALLVVAIILIPTLMVTLRPLDPLYQEGNIVWSSSTMSDMQQDLQHFDTAGFSELSCENHFLHTDSITGDKLFYSLDILGELATTKIIIVVNEKYHYPFGLGEQITTVTSANYNITYQKRFTENDYDDILSVEYRGEIKVQTETVYFTYTQTIATDDADFLADIQSLIQVKE